MLNEATSVKSGMDKDQVTSLDPLTQFGLIYSHKLDGQTPVSQFTNYRNKKSSSSNPNKDKLPAEINKFLIQNHRENTSMFNYEGHS